MKIHLLLVLVLVFSFFYIGFPISLFSQNMGEGALQSKDISTFRSTILENGTGEDLLVPRPPIFPGNRLAPVASGDDALGTLWNGTPANLLKPKSSIDSSSLGGLGGLFERYGETTGPRGWSSKHGIDKQEVQPDIVHDMVDKRYEIDDPLARNKITTMQQPAELIRQSKCGEAVRQLRSTPALGAAPSPGDRIDFFENTCLFSIRNAAPLTPEQRGAANQCLAAYSNFESSCYGDKPSPNAEKINEVVGVLATEGVIDGKPRRFIICSGTLTSNLEIVSAQHCLLDVQRDRDGNFRLFFYPFDAIDREQFYEIADVARSPAMRKESLTDAVNIYQNWAAAPPIADDVAKFFVSPGTSIPKVETMTIGQVSGLDRVQLPAFQRLVENLLLLKARLSNERLFNDDDLLRTGYWRDAFRTDFSPTCLIMPFSVSEASLYDFDVQLSFGHTCQSLGTASGAPIFRYDGDEPTLVAVHSTAVNKVPGREGPVEAYSPKNAAVSVSEILKVQ